jgi:glycosyltransferase involved in cell wall biosynthesis
LPEHSTQNTGSERRRVLFIAYTFPPVGGAGVQRTAKFTKYLPQFGWDVSVLTVSNPSVPVVDDSLLSDIPPSTDVIRTRTFEPSYSAKRAVGGTHSVSAIGRFLRSAARSVLLPLLQPDPQILWTWPAFLAATKATRTKQYDVIVASAPPFSSFLLGATLSRHTGLPLVLDYRDEWSVSNTYWENRHLGRISLAVQARMERHALRRAMLVVATTASSATALRTLSHDAGSRASVTHIYNGFDPDDFAAPIQRVERTQMLRLVYTGTLHNLVSVQPLVVAIEALAATQPDLAQRLEIVFAGRRTSTQDELLRRLNGLCRLDARDYVSHGEAIELMRSADILCVILSDLPGADRVVPAKVFEYLASGRPILAIAPPGELWDLLDSYPAAFRFRLDAMQQLRDWLDAALRGTACKFDIAHLNPDPYSRRSQAQYLASMLNALSRRGRAEPAPVPRTRG